MAVETIHPLGTNGVFIASLHRFARSLEFATGSRPLLTIRRPTVFPGISSGLTLRFMLIRFLPPQPPGIKLFGRPTQKPCFPRF